MLHGVRQLFLVLNPSDKLSVIVMISASIRFLRAPFCSQAEVAIAEGRKPHPVTGATALHLALGPRLRPRPRPLRLSEYPWEHLGPRPGLPWGGACLPAPYGGAEGVRPPPGPAPLPPGPTNPFPPAPPSMGSESRGDRSPSAAMAAATAASRFGQRYGSSRLCRHRSHSRRRRYRVPRAPARRAPSSPRNQWPAPPRSAPQHVIGYPRPAVLLFAETEQFLVL